MLGHGTNWGLMAVGQFPDVGSYIIDDSISEILSTKRVLYIWCNADEYVHRNERGGFFTGMFISEIGEATTFGFWDVEQNTIDESNHGFARIVSEHINDPLEDLYENVIQEYSHLAKTNPIIRFNLDRSYYRRTCVGINRKLFSF